MPLQVLESQHIISFIESHMRWMCGVSLKDRRRSVDLYNLLNVWSIADVARRGRLRWFGHLECKGVYDWALVCRNVVVAGLRRVGRGRKWRVGKK